MKITNFLHKFNISDYNSNMKSSMPAIIYGEHLFQTFQTFIMIGKEKGKKKIWRSRIPIKYFFCMQDFFG